MESMGPLELLLMRNTNLLFKIIGNIEDTSYGNITISRHSILWCRRFLFLKRGYYDEILISLESLLLIYFTDQGLGQTRIYIQLDAS